MIHLIHPDHHLALIRMERAEQHLRTQRRAPSSPTPRRLDVLRRRRRRPVLASDIDDEAVTIVLT